MEVPKSADENPALRAQRRALFPPPPMAFETKTSSTSVVSIFNCFRLSMSTAAAISSMGVSRKKPPTGEIVVRAPAIKNTFLGFTAIS